LTEINEPLGEYWTISAHPTAESIVKNGIFSGRTLSDVYQSHRELFEGCKSDRFPLLVKIIDAADDLSVQVHPDDAYAKRREKQFGKNECWYVLEAKYDSKIIVGHTAQSTEELKTRIENQTLEEVLIEHLVKPGDFFLIEAGTIHALGKNTVILEVQQSSDVTYRVYDYNRLDAQGNPRALHIQKALDVLSVGKTTQKENFKVRVMENLIVTDLVSTKHFDVQKYEVLANIVWHNATGKFYLFTVAEGTFVVQGTLVRKGESFIATSLSKQIAIEGSGSFIVSHL